MVLFHTSKFHLIKYPFQKYSFQKDIYNKALKFKEDNITKVDSYEEFKSVLTEKGGFILAHWDGTAEEEEQIKQEIKKREQQDLVKAREQIMAIAQSVGMPLKELMGSQARAAKAGALVKMAVR